MFRGRILNFLGAQQSASLRTPGGPVRQAYSYSVPSPHWLFKNSCTELWLCSWRRLTCVCRWVPWACRRRRSATTSLRPPATGRVSRSPSSSRFRIVRLRWVKCPVKLKDAFLWDSARHGGKVLAKILLFSHTRMNNRACYKNNIIRKFLQQ